MNQDVQSARRGAEMACGKQVTIPPAAIQAPVAPAPVASGLDGTWEAQTNPAVRIVVKDGLVRMKSTAPVVRTGQADIVETKRDGHRFNLAMRGSDGDFKSLRALAGSVTEEKLQVTAIDGDIAPALAEAFKTTYRRI